MLNKAKTGSAKTDAAGHGSDLHEATMHSLISGYTVWRLYDQTFKIGNWSTAPLSTYIWANLENNEVKMSGTSAGEFK